MSPDTVEEFDFYNAQYLDKSTTPPNPIPLEIEVVITHLSEELALLCADRTEHWHTAEKRLLDIGELDLVNDQAVIECLRIKAIAKYNFEDDEFEANSVFCSGATKADGSPTEVSRSIRHLIGFIYLRALRTGSRALSLGRGSLLDLILQRQQIRAGIWESALDRLRGLDPPIDEGSATLLPVLDNIEKRLRQYVPLTGQGRATQLFVSQLTREHLRKTISFFLRTESGQGPVPFQDVGSGTLSTLVLALLSFIAEAKQDSVIFAMEEPEIAVSPHTQRRIAHYLLSGADQCFVTSHSPYVIECFEPDRIRVLRKEDGAVVIGKELRVGEKLKDKTYRRHSRRWLAEAMLSRAVIVGAGLTEREVLQAAAAKLEGTGEDPTFYPLDLSGVSIMAIDGEGSIPEFGEFFFDLDIKAYVFFDAKPINAEAKARIDASYAYVCQTAYTGAEKMLVEECPTERLWQLLEELRDGSENSFGIPQSPMPVASVVKDWAYRLLKARKGCGYAGRLMELCDATEIPGTVLGFLLEVYTDFPRPEPVPAFTAPTRPEDVI